MTAAGVGRRVVLDTDIGTAVDDAIALAVLLGSDEVELIGCTTVYGDTQLRARIAQRVIELSGRAWGSIPCIPGVEEPLSGKEVWWAGHEGQLYHPMAELPRRDWDAPEWLVERAAERPGEIDIVAIGPLSNIAAALRLDPEFAHDVRRLWIMGGRGDGAPEIEHNFGSDAVAAAEVLASDLPITLVGIDLTTRVRLHEDQVRGMGGDTPLGRLLAREAREWNARRHEDGTCPHDATAVLAMLRADLFSCRDAALQVITSGPDAGRCVAIDRADSVGPERQVVGDVSPGVEAEILRRVEHASVGLGTVTGVD